MVEIPTLLDPSASLTRKTPFPIGQMLTKFLAVAVCAFITFGGQYPPVHAQIRRQSVQTVPVLTVEDAVQDNNIAAVNKHVENTDSNVARVEAALVKTEGDISGIQGEERGVGVILGGLSILQIFLQFRRKTDERE